MTDLYLIRHGHYIGVENGFLTDKGLSPLGVRQVERLRDRLSATHEIAPHHAIARRTARARPQPKGRLAIGGIWGTGSAEFRRVHTE